MGEDTELDDVDLDLFGYQVLIALEQGVCESSKPLTLDDDVRQLKLPFDAAML